MKRDISAREDIELLVNTFYDTVKKDETIGYIFNQTIGEDWSHHLPKMYAFWESVLFSKPGYEGNPMRAHINLDKKIPLEKKHFDRWFEIWTATVDALFAGEVANLAKYRASLMVNLISIKVEMSRDKNFIQ